MTFKALACLIFIGFFYSCLSKFCKEFERENLEFFPLRHCQRSNKTVVGFADVETLGECADLTRSMRGLAFNFSPKHRRERNRFKVNKQNESEAETEKVEFHNCEVLECPEFRNFSSVVNDTRYDYYSLYTRPSPSENSTCVPSVGMFMLSKKRRNYSVAHEICSKAGGNLAHIASEVRNVELSKLLRISTNSSLRERTAYVGLNESLRNKFFTSNSEPLNCFHYRAWAAGHPPEVRRPGCVVITPEASWKVFNCNRKLLFMCELFTSGPNPLINNFNEECSIERPNNRFRSKKTFNN